MSELLDYEPARVHIVKDDTAKAPARRVYKATSKTYLAGTTPELILPRTSGRCRATVTVLGVVGTAGNIVLADTEADAQAAVTYGATVLQTLAGCAAQPGQVVDIRHNEEVWLARLGTAGTAPIVGVISEYD